MKKVLMTIGVLLVAGGAYAAGEREARPVACMNYSVAKLADGSEVGMCQSAKGKPRLVRSFVVAKVKQPETGSYANVLVGFP